MNKEKREVGKTYDVDGRTFKLVVGGICNKCDLHESDLCIKMPPCELHDGHYKEVSVMSAKKYYKQWSKELSFLKLMDTGISVDYDSIFEFAEDYAKNN